MRQTHINTRGDKDGTNFNALRAKHSGKHKSNIQSLSRHQQPGIHSRDPNYILYNLNSRNSATSLVDMCGDTATYLGHVFGLDEGWFTLDAGQSLVVRDWACHVTPARKISAGKWGYCDNVSASNESTRARISQPCSV